MHPGVNLDDVLRCPRCHGALEPRADGYDCRPCRVRYPVRDGIASFLPADAEPLADEPPAPRG
jgi:uncharacterized protein YbaR (Trm112 family)